MKIDSFYKNSFTVVVSNLCTGIISFIFSIVLSRELGTEGLGLYGLIMPVYFLLLGLVSDGLITAISKITAVYYNKRDFLNLNRTIRTVFIFIFMWAFFIAFLFFISSNLISTVIINDSRSKLALKVLSPALIFVPLSAIMKGYFYGIGKFKVTALTDIFEKFMRVAGLLSIIMIFTLNDVANTVTAAYTAIAAGECISFVILFTLYTKYRNNFIPYKSKRQNRLQLLFNTLAISVPLCINGFFSSILSSITTLILPRRLASTGMAYGSALSLIGSFNGMALSISMFPIIIINSISTVLIPDLSLSVSKKDYWSTENRIRQVFKISMLVGISTLISCQSVPGELGFILYKRANLGAFIRFASFCSVTCFISSPSYGILNGLGKQKVLLKNSLIVAFEELVIIYALTGIPVINIYGVGISVIITSITSFALNYHEIRKSCAKVFPVPRVIIYILVGIFTYAVLRKLCSLLPGSLFTLKTVSVIFLSFTMVFFFSNKLEKLLDE